MTMAVPVLQRKDLPRENIYWVIIILLFLISLVPRFYDIMKFLPVYSIDENDIVEFAVGFMGGDLDPHWYKYGPLYAYLLAGVYFVESFFYNGNTAQFIQDIFFNPTRFYYTARFINSIINILIVLFTYRLAKKIFNKEIALITLTLTVFPFFDRLVNYTIRVDTLLALWTILTLYYLIQVHHEPGMKNYLLAAVFWGLCLATKPLPALLILPTAFWMHGLGVKDGSPKPGKKIMSRKKGKDKPSRFKDKSLPEQAIEAFTSPAFYLFLAAGIGVSIIFNPYSLINFDAFKAEQITAVQSEGERNFIPGWDITRFFAPLGYVFTLLAVLVIIYYIYQSVKRKNYLSLALLSYPVIFWLAFARGAAREYFYVPIMPVVIIFIAHFISEMAEKISKRSGKFQSAFILISILIVLLQPGADLIAKINFLNRSGDYPERHTALAGKKWFEENLPSDSRILLYGYYVHLPHLVDRDPQKQAQFGEHFMYFRWKNKYLVDHFLKAHADYLKTSRPVFNLENIRDNLRDKEVQLFASCRRNKIDYVVSFYDLSRYPEFKSRILKVFADPEYPFGLPYSIYQVKDE